MLIAITTGGLTEFPDACLFHATKANGLGVCGHARYEDERSDLICQYTNTPKEHHNPPCRCPIRNGGVEGVTIESVGK